MEGIEVLLVDDEVEFAETVSERLETRGFETSIAPSGDDALKKIEAKDFDVVVLDLRMPGRDGLETLREIKLRRPLTEVIMLSGRGTEETAVEGLKYGAFDFLTKPPEIGELVEKLLQASSKKTEHLGRIEKAQEAARERSRAAVAEEGPPVADDVPPKGKLLVLGRESEFSEALIDYALDMAARLSYEVLALNAAGFSKEALRSFPSAWDRVCRDFRRVSEEKVVPLREASEQRDISFSHVVKFSSPDEAIKELQHDEHEIDFVVSEPADELIAPGVGPDILVYSPT